jgi:plastocyanin
MVSKNSKKLGRILITRRPRSFKNKAGLSTGNLTIAILLIVMIFSSVAYLELQALVSAPTAKSSGLGIAVPPTTVFIKLEWAPQVSGQDRFFPDTIVVDQGDNISILFEANDSDAHTFTLGPPYNFQMNLSGPGLTDYLTNTNFTTPSTGNSPDVQILNDTPLFLTGQGWFIAKYAGMFEYYCVYHLALGMFGYITVLPNADYTNATTPS